jgi:hypothetical protein
MHTLESLSSLTTGSEINETTWDAGSIRLQMESGDTRSWNELPNIFELAREAGLNTAVAGWWLPYCSDLADALVACSTPTIDELRPSTVYASVVHQLHEHVEGHWVRARLGLENGWSMRRELFAMYQKVHRDGMAMVADPGLGLVLLHWPIPHPLGIYDRYTDRISFSRQNNHLDNYELVDQALGEIRAALVTSGLDERTTILLTSDHPLRPDEWNYRATWTAEESTVSQEQQFPWVPFLLRLAGETAPIPYSKQFNTLLAKDLILDILAGQVLTADDASAWIDTHR